MLMTVGARARFASQGRSVGHGIQFGLEINWPKIETTIEIYVRMTHTAARHFDATLDTSGVSGAPIHHYRPTTHLPDGCHCSTVSPRGGSGP